MAHQSVTEKSRTHQAGIIQFQRAGVNVGNLGQAQAAYNFSAAFDVTVTGRNVLIGLHSGAVVTSVSLSMPTGFAVAGSPVTGAGGFAVTYSGQFPATSMPALTGDVTTVAGSTATVVGQILGNVLIDTTVINGRVLIASGVAGGWVSTAISGDATLSVTGAITSTVKAGRLLRAPQVLTTGTVSYTTPANCNNILAVLVGDGGGGGGTSTVAASAAAAGGGGGGATTQKFIAVTPSTAYTCAIGAGGAGGAATGANGSSGGGTTLTVGATTYTAGGGGGGVGSAATTAVSVAVGGNGGTGTNGDLNVTGPKGLYGLTLSGTAGVSGMGANTPYGSGGQARFTNAAGLGGAGFGGGGGGACVINGGTANIGGAGAPGLIIIYEYS